MIEFQDFSLRSWRQFADVQLDLTNSVTILAGSNGSGKTTLINILARHFGFTLLHVAGPSLSKRERKALRQSINESHVSGDFHGELDVGSISYSNNVRSLLTFPKEPGPTYALRHTAMQAVPGIYMPSHRPPAVYTKIENIPTEPINPEALYAEYQRYVVNSLTGARATNPGQAQKRSIISLAVFGEGNNSVVGREIYVDLLADFQGILRRVLPKEIGFHRLIVDLPEVALETNQGTFSLDAMSGGMTSVFGMAWQIFMFAIQNREFYVIIDEPENHLHPSMQRVLLPNLVSAFPRAKFIVATHSPFIASSFEDAAVYALTYEPHRGIVSSKLAKDSVSGTPNTILREVLDVDSNLPVWVEDAVRSLLLEARGVESKRRSTFILEALARHGLTDALVEFGQKRRR